MMNFLRLVHAWSGAALSLLLIVVGLTGSLLILKDDWLRATLPAARAPVVATPVAFGAVAEGFERQFTPPPQSVSFAGHGVGIHHVYLGERGVVLADQQGRVLEEPSTGRRFDELVVGLHASLLSGSAGALIVGFSGVAALVLTGTGLVIWAPAWRSFAWRFWPRAMQRRDLVGTHRNLGAVFALPIVLFSLTGAGMAFGEQVKPALTRLLPFGERPASPVASAGEGDVDWPKALAAAQSRFPDAELRSIAWPGWPGDVATVWLKRPSEWHPGGRTKVMIDPATGRILGTANSDHLALGMRVYGLFFPLHTVQVGGRIYDLVSFLAGLAIAGLGGFGLWSFVIKPRGRSSRR